VDSNNNGFVDGIVLTFSESVVVSTVHAADFTTSNPVYPITSVSSVHSSANDWMVTLVVTEAAVNDGNAVPTVTYAASRLTDPAGNPLVSGSMVTATDGVLPRLVSATGVPVSDLLTVTFSELVSHCAGGTALTTADFHYQDGNSAGAQSMLSISGSGLSRDITVQFSFVDSDFSGPSPGNGDSINAILNSISDSNGNAVPATPVYLVGPSAAFHVVTAVWLCVLLIAVAFFAV